MNSLLRPRTLRLSLLVCAIGLAGCSGEPSLTQFRDAAAQSVSTGLVTLFQGFVDGVIAAYDIEAAAATDG